MPTIRTNVENIKLYVGKWIKNYKEVCRILGEGPLSHNSKKAQLKRWACFFSWRIEGQRWYIEEIFDEPLPMVDGRSNGNNSKYLPLLKEIIVAAIDDTEDEESIEAGLNYWYRSLGMVNHHYRPSEQAMLNEANERYVEKLCFAVSSLCKGRLTAALKSLQKDGIIYWRENIRITLGNGREIIASPEDKECIAEIEREILQKLEAQDKSRIFLTGKYQKYYSLRNQRLSEKKWNWVYSTIMVTPGPNYNHALSLISKDSIPYKKQQLNALVVSAIEKSFKKEYEKQEQEVNEWHDRYSNKIGVPQKPWFDPLFYDSMQDLINQYIKRDI